MKPVYFKSQSEFRKWLEKNHGSESEIVVGYYKTVTGKPSMTWSQSVDEALCFGWIDGIRRSVDEERYCIRFTPRRPGSNWSKINIKKVEELEKKGLMKKAGIEIFKSRKEERSGVYSFENRPAKLTDDYEKLFRKNKTAWDFFNGLPPSYKKNVIHWILSARQEETKLRRLEKAINSSENHSRIY